MAAAAGCGGCVTRRARRRPPMHCSGQRDAAPSRARLCAPPSEPTASPSASAWQRGSPSPSLGGGPFSPSPPLRLTAARDAPMRPLPTVCAGGSCARSGPRAQRAIEGTPRSARAPPRCTASARRACSPGGAPVSATALRSPAPSRCARSRAGAARCESAHASDQPFARGGRWAHCAASARTCARWLSFVHSAAGGGGARVRPSCEVGSRRAGGDTHAAAACARSRERGRSRADSLGLKYEINGCVTTSNY
ncbi:hypothetical protein T492DRAFT_1053434, partial [Pavlovales sp. CCMP2436]